MGETPGRGRGTLFWVSQDCVWISQGQKRGWKVGSGALLRKGLLKDCRLSSFHPPEEERRRKKIEKSPLIQFNSGLQDVWTCPNRANSCLLGWWISQSSPSPAGVCVRHLSGLRLPLALKDTLNCTKTFQCVHTFSHHTYNAGIFLLLLFVTHTSSFLGQVKGGWQWIYLRQWMVVVKETQCPKVFLMNLSTHPQYLNLHPMMWLSTAHKSPSAWQVSMTPATATTVGLHLLSQK